MPRHQAVATPKSGVQRLPECPAGWWQVGSALQYLQSAVPSETASDWGAEGTCASSAGPVWWAERHPCSTTSAIRAARAGLWPGPPLWVRLESVCPTCVGRAVRAEAPRVGLLLRNLVVAGARPRCGLPSLRGPLPLPAALALTPPLAVWSPLGAGTANSPLEPSLCCSEGALRGWAPHGQLLPTPTRLLRGATEPERCPSSLPWGFWSTYPMTCGCPLATPPFMPPADTQLGLMEPHFFLVYCNSCDFWLRTCFSE